MSTPRFAFAGDRRQAVDVLDHLMELGHEPSALLLPDEGSGSHDGELIERCGHLPELVILRGAAFRAPEGITALVELDLDLMLFVHFQLMVPDEVLALPRWGCLNLHPAFLPYNRGWHTATWAMLEGTPLGATLHVMERTVDTGAIVHQRQLRIGPGDTADTVYERLRLLEADVFREAWPSIASGTFERRPQKGEGTFHRKADLFRPEVQLIDRDAESTAGALLDRIRALSTFRAGEAAYFEEDGRRYRVQLIITEEPAR